MKTLGAKNITPFAKRKTIETSNDAEIRHLADMSGTPVSMLKQLYQHQENYLKWLHGRHKKIIELQTKLISCTGAGPKKGPKGAKPATFEKYLWYAEQAAMLDAINAFELFFKRTFVGLTHCLREYIDPASIKDEVDFNLIWAMDGKISAADLLFEQKLFHKTHQVDESAQILVGKKRYADPRLKNRVSVIQGIFQIRHTLSHNGGLVTKSDAGKFKLYGFNLQDGEVIDPTKNDLRVSVFREILYEAEKFTEWLLTATVDFLIKCDKNGKIVPSSLRADLRGLLGNNAKEWKRVPWKL